MKIVFIQYHPNTIKTEKDYYLDVLRQNGFDVEYWDLTSLFPHKIRLPDTIRRGYEHYFTSYEELKAKLAKQDLLRTFFIVQITYEIDTIRLYRLLSKSKCTLYHHYIGAMPKGSPRFVDKLLNNISFKVIPKIIRKVVPSICLKLGLVKHYDVVFAAGGAAMERFKQHSTIVPINLFDYDNVLLNPCNGTIQAESNYCVYLDDNWVAHPDVEILRLPRLDPKNHYELLNKFFIIVERVLGTSVVIAAHPKSNYASNPFGNRKIVKYQTLESTKDCRFVISSVSTSISYAIAYSKPVMIVFTDEIKSKYRNTLYNEIMSLAKSLGCKCYNINRVREEEIAVGMVDKFKYAQYKLNYLTSDDSEHRLSRDIVLEHFTGVGAKIQDSESSMATGG